MQDEVTGREPARIEGGRRTVRARPEQHQRLSTAQTEPSAKNKESVLSTLLPTGFV